MKTMDVTSLGELLIDFTPAGISEDGCKLFEQNPGGAPANVLAALNKFGLKTAFIGKIGADMHGDFLRTTLESAGISTQGLITDADYFTTLAFVSLSETGERDFSFARKPGADTMLTSAEINSALIEDSKVFHVGSLSMTDEPARSATLTSLKTAQRAGCIISYDPNYRPPLWNSEKEAITQMQCVIPFADIIKISDEETRLLTGHDNITDAANTLLTLGPSIVLITLGQKGAYAACKSGSCIIDSFPSNVVDTTGAGDSFLGGFLYQLIQYNLLPSNVNLNHLEQFVRFANATASLCVEKKGAIPAMPDLAEVKKRLFSQK